jgi:hypothetical protein
MTAAFERNELTSTRCGVVKRFSVPEADHRVVTAV